MKWPLDLPLRIVDSMTLGINRLTANMFPLHNREIITNLRIQNSTFTKPLVIFKLGSIRGKTSSIEVTWVQKFYGNEMHLVSASTFTLPLPISKHFLEIFFVAELPAYWWTKLIFERTTKGAKDALRQALRSSAGVDLGTTESVCRKSPANKIKAPPKSL